VEEERPEVVERRRAQVAQLRERVAHLQGLLGNQAFVEKAPDAVVQRERERLAELQEQLRTLGA